MVNSELAVVYLANMIKISRMDGDLNPLEQEALEKACDKLFVDAKTIAEAVKAVARGDHRVTPVGRLSDKIRNLEDMLFVALIDGELTGDEKEEMTAFAREIGLSNDQVKTILTETKIKIDLCITALECCHCGITLPPKSRFCTACGNRLPE